LKAEIYWLFFTLSKIPEGMYDPLEMQNVEKGKDGKFTGGLGHIMIVRYKDTPVGTYDELAIFPGNFTVPTPPDTPKSLNIPKKSMRISRIYVSQRTTCYNGRIAWNIPKHLARFSFSAPVTPTGESPPESLTLKVYRPGTKNGDGVAPFFAATLKPWKWVPAMPLSSKYVPISNVFAQPPIPAAPGYGKQENGVQAVKSGDVDPYDIDPKREDELLVGTDTWKAFPIEFYSPTVRGCWARIHKPGEGEGGKRGTAEEAEARKEAVKNWPVDVKPWSVCAWMEDTQMGIDKPVEWKL
jgi:hypothetical protein